MAQSTSPQNSNAQKPSSHNTVCVCHMKKISFTEKNHCDNFKEKVNLICCCFQADTNNSCLKIEQNCVFLSCRTKKMGGISSVAKVIPICSIWLLIISLNNKLKLCPSNSFFTKMCVFSFLSQLRLAN